MWASFEVPIWNLKFSNSSLVSWNINDSGNLTGFRFTARLRYLVSIPYNSAKCESSITCFFRTVKILLIICLLYFSIEFSVIFQTLQKCFYIYCLLVRFLIRICSYQNSKKQNNVNSSLVQYLPNNNWNKLSQTSKSWSIKQIQQSTIAPRQIIIQTMQKKHCPRRGWVEYLNLINQLKSP